MKLKWVKVTIKATGELVGYYYNPYDKPAHYIAGLLIDDLSGCVCRKVK